MKKRIKIFFLICGTVCLALPILFLGYVFIYYRFFYKIDVREEVEFQTQYTEEEHIQRLNALISDRFQAEIEEGYLVDYKVYILYAFGDDDPEFFLADFEFSEEIEGSYTDEQGETVSYTTKFSHFIGTIINDEYCMSAAPYVDELSHRKAPNYSSVPYEYYELMMDGKSIFSIYGYEEEKKYFGKDILAVALDGEIYQIANLYTKEGFDVIPIEFSAPERREKKTD